ncbi:hypothetical protein MKW98_018681 [Papaver atlanticum]|uniref:Aspartate transaminase n=1 Tax=Papaver atlanticum TaxID=357466 RepID=A0AAD4T5L8_9MAGN|nr:hypothetical protein MKW98_018681 [Papaver atlanticum]
MYNRSPNKLNLGVGAYRTEEGKPLVLNVVRKAEQGGYILTDAERCNDCTYVLDILHTLEVFGGTLDEHMHLLLLALIRLFKVDASVEIRRAAIKTLTRLILCVQVTGHVAALVHHLKLVLDGNSDEPRKDAVDALCSLAHALGENAMLSCTSSMGRAQ